MTEETKVSALEAYEKKVRMDEETKGILPVEEYEMMLDRLLRRLDGYSQPPRYMIDCCSAVARMCEAKRSLMRQRREKAFLATVEDFLTVAAGVGVVMLLCGFCWIAA